MFGHLITMNFNQRGNRHKTHIGAVFSIFIKVFIYMYIGLTFKQLLYMDANKNGSTRSTSPIEELGTVYYMESGLRVFYVMRRQMTGKPLLLTEELKSYLDMYYLQITNDWNINPGFNTPT